MQHFVNIVVSFVKIIKIWEYQLTNHLEIGNIHLKKYKSHNLCEYHTKSMSSGEEFMYRIENPEKSIHVKIATIKADNIRKKQNYFREYYRFYSILWKAAVYWSTW